MQINFSFSWPSQYFCLVLKCLELYSYLIPAQISLFTSYINPKVQNYVQDNQYVSIYLRQRIIHATLYDTIFS